MQPTRCTDIGAGAWEFMGQETGETSKLAATLQAFSYLVTNSDSGFPQSRRGGAIEEDT
jgi:hypothetical protein